MVFSRGHVEVKYINSLVWNIWQIKDGLETYFFSQNNIRITTISP